MSKFFDYLKEIGSNIVSGISQRTDEVGKEIGDAVSGELSGFGKPDKASKEINSILGEFASMFRSAHPNGGDPLRDLDSSERAALAAATSETKNERATAKAENAMAAEVRDEPAIDLLPARSIPREPTRQRDAERDIGDMDR